MAPLREQKGGLLMKKLFIAHVLVAVLAATMFSGSAEALPTVSCLADLEATGLEVTDVSTFVKGIPPKKGYKLTGFASFFADPKMVMCVDTPSGRVTPATNRVIQVAAGAATLWVADGKEAAFAKAAARPVPAPQPVQAAPAPAPAPQPVTPADPKGVPAPQPIGAPASKTGQEPQVVVAGEQPAASQVTPAPAPAPKPEGVTEAELRKKFRLTDLSTTSGGKNLKPREGWKLKGHGTFVVPPYAIGVDTPSGRVRPGKKVRVNGEATLWLTPEGIELF